jgi:hypothetical protein
MNETQYQEALIEVKRKVEEYIDNRANRPDYYYTAIMYIDAMMLAKTDKLKAAVIKWLETESTFNLKYAIMCVQSYETLHSFNAFCLIDSAVNE